MQPEVISTQMTKTTVKQFTHPNGFIFHYVIKEVDGETSFTLSFVLYKELRYTLHITPEQQAVIKSIPFTESRDILKNCTSVDKLFTCEEDIILFTDFSCLFKGFLGSHEFLTDYLDTVLNPILPIYSQYLYQASSYNNQEELLSIVRWMQANPSKVEIIGELSVTEVPYYNQNDTTDLYHLNGNVIIHDNNLLSFFNARSSTGSYFSLNEGFTKLFKHILSLVKDDKDSLVLARNFASPMIIQRAKDIYASKDTDKLQDDSLSYFVYACLSLNEITDYNAYHTLLKNTDLSVATTYTLVCLTILELIQNNGEIN